MEEHELPKFRAVIANHTLAPRDSQAVRYALDIPAVVEDTLGRVPNHAGSSLEAVLWADAAARTAATSAVKAHPL